jgi:cyanophycinase
LSKTLGRVILIGGEPQRTPLDATLMSRVAFWAGGADAVWVIITTGSAPRVRGASAYRRLLLDLGAREVRVLQLRSREGAEDSRALNGLRQATGVLLLAQDPEQLVSLLVDTPLQAELVRAFSRGACIVGPHAGAAALTARIVGPGHWAPPPQTDTDASAMADVHPRAGLVSLNAGLGLLPGLVLDHHYCEKQRWGRLVSLVALSPDLLGVGVDAGTALVVAPGRAVEVVGQGAVTIFDGGRLSHSTASHASSGQLLGLCHVQLNTLPTGFSFRWRRNGDGAMADGSRASATLLQLMRAISSTEARSPISPKYR